MKIKTLCVQQIHKDHTQDIVVPIHTSVIFAMDSPSSDEGFQYGRIGNETRQTLETVLRRIHNATHGIATCSGSSAILMACLLSKTGGTILHHNELYEGTRRMFDLVLSQFGVKAVSCDFHNLQLTSTAILKHTPNIVWIETPTNPTLRVLDIQHIAQLAHMHDALVVVDTTMCSGLLQRPLALHADIVVESLTKIVNGHSDALGGFIATNNEILGKRLQFLTQTTGPVLGPWESSLILRGLKTAAIRIQAQQQHATQVTKWLKHNPNIAQVSVPGSASTREHILVKKQMLGKGPIVTFKLAPIIDPVQFASRLRLIRISHSFGGVESIIQHPFTMMSHDGLPKNLLPDKRLFRLSIGLEDHQDILDDLKQALEGKAPHVI